MVVDRHNQAVVIALDVKDRSFARNDAGRAELRLKFRRVLPGRLFNFGVPGIQMFLYSASEPAIHRIAYESVEGRSGNDSHLQMILCSHPGSKTCRFGRVANYDFSLIHACGLFPQSASAVLSTAASASIGLAQESNAAGNASLGGSRSEKGQQQEQLRGLHCVQEDTALERDEGKSKSRSLGSAEKRCARDDTSVVGG